MNGSTNSREPVPVERIDGSIDAILASDEFSDEPTLFDELIEWLSERFEIDPSPEQLSAAANVAAWTLGILAVLALALLLVYVARAWRGARRAAVDDGAATDPGVEQRVERLLREAEDARTAGDRRLALRLYLFALIVGLGDRGDLVYRDAWTNRELLRRGRPNARTRSMLEPLVLELEAKEFGDAPIEDDDVERLRAACRRHLRKRAAVAR